MIWGFVGGMGGGVRVLVTLALVVSVVGTSPVGAEEILWFDDSRFHESGGDTYNATKEPDDGEYLNRSDDATYYYDSSTETLTFLEDNQNENETTSNQAGECEYVLGNWTEETAQYTYGRCINLRVKNNTNREVQSRLNVREVNAGPYKMVVDVFFLDANGNRTGDGYRVYKVLCFSDAPDNLVIRCEDVRDRELDDSDWPTDAEEWCLGGALFEYESGSYEYRLSVQPPCRDI